jgi:hypothetical protein
LGFLTSLLLLFWPLAMAVSSMGRDRSGPIRAVARSQCAAGGTLSMPGSPPGQSARAPKENGGRWAKPLTINVEKLPRGHIGRGASSYAEPPKRSRS